MNFIIQDDILLENLKTYVKGHTSTGDGIHMLLQDIEGSQYTKNNIAGNFYLSALDVIVELLKETGNDGQLYK